MSQYHQAAISALTAPLMLPLRFDGATMSDSILVHDWPLAYVPVNHKGVDRAVSFKLAFQKWEMSEKRGLEHPRRAIAQH